jgi:hypothetical protein
MDKGGRVTRSPRALRGGFFLIRPCRSIRHRSSPLMAGAEALASPPKKWSAQLSYYATMTEMDRRHKRLALKNLPPRLGGARIASAARFDESCWLWLQSDGSEHEFRQ